MRTRFSTREIGRAFESHALSFLNGDLRMALTHVGGAGDGGVDLRGDWWLPRVPKVRRGKAKAGSGTVGGASGSSGLRDSGPSSSSSSTSPSSSSSSSSSSAPSSSSSTPSPSPPPSDSSPPSPPPSSPSAASPTPPPSSPSPAPSLPTTKWPPPPPGLKRNGTPNTRAIAPLRVLAQCKAERKPTGPNYVRELEGVLAAAGPDVLGVLVSQSGFTSGAMHRALAARWPLLLVHLEGGRPEDAAVSEGEMGVGEDVRVVKGEGQSLSEARHDGADTTSATTTATTTSTSTPPSTPPTRGPNPTPPAFSARAPRVPVAGAWWNPPLGTLLAGRVELRRELSPGAVRVGVWCGGARMGAYGPGAV